MGLKIMKFRSETIGGTLDIHPLRPSGSAIVCVVPMAETIPGNREPRQ